MEAMPNQGIFGNLKRIGNIVNLQIVSPEKSPSFVLRLSLFRPAQDRLLRKRNALGFAIFTGRFRIPVYEDDRSPIGK